MKGCELFFADTYALIEIVKGNPAYKPYIEYKLLTTEYNLAELYYFCIREHDLKLAHDAIETYAEHMISLSFSCIPKAMHLKRQCKREKLSYIDCIGYILALEWNIPFLTGDNQFKDKPNVEFVR